MKHQPNETQKAIQHALSCMNDCTIILGSVYDIYFAETSFLDGSMHDTPEAKRFLEGYPYLSGSLDVVISMVGTVRQTLERLQHEGADDAGDGCRA